uniref:EGF-like domain-containing protein n=1 Tax=Trichobilharzia regenti TaxID=157069 RepID=A0AA85JSQ6_TRIRE|nr:unnamed protein product [Trichobilharzia regenti]
MRQPFHPSSQLSLAHKCEFVNKASELSTYHDPCQSNPCQNNADCVNIHDWKGRTSKNGLNTQSDYYCVCLKGWTGQNCTEDIDDCVKQPCLNGGTCEDRPNMRFYCHCPADYVGQTCEHRNPCRISPCLNGGLCQSDPFGQFSCKCPRWYTGLRCEKEINPCYPHSPCLGKNSVCYLITSKNRIISGPPFLIRKSEYITDFKCDCGSGFTGRYCDMKQNLCQMNSCQNGATCLQNGENYSCLCPVGFTGTLCNIPVNNAKHPTSNSSSILIQNKTSKLNSMNTDTKQKFNLFNDYCSHIGCDNARPGDGICQANCIYANCLNAELELKHDCQYWIKCLQLTVQPMRQYNQTTCVEQFKNGKCQPECNRNECYLDGFDCMQSASYCELSDSCLKTYGDGVCQKPCNTFQCGNDGGDCDNGAKEEESHNYVRKYVLFYLNTNQSQFMENRNQFLGNLGQILQALVRLAKDESTGEDLVEDIPSKYQFKLLLEVVSPSSPLNLVCKETDTHLCTNPIVLLLKTNELKDYILAALTTVKYRSLFSIKYFTFVDSPSQSHFKAPWEEDIPSTTRISKEAIGLYVCICILAGITILLVLFLVFQRDSSWQKPLKRVRTNGIWCPPIPPIYEKTNQVEMVEPQSIMYYTGINPTVSAEPTPPSSMLIPTTVNTPKTSNNAFKQALPSNIFRTYLNPSVIDEKEKFLPHNWGKYEIEGNPTGVITNEIPNTDFEWVDGYSPPWKKKCSNQDDIVEDFLSDNSMNLFTSPKCLDNYFTKQDEIYSCGKKLEEKYQQRECQLKLAERIDSSMFMPNQTAKDSEVIDVNKNATNVIGNNEIKQVIVGVDNSVKKELTEIITTMDGLHPCNTVQHNQIENLLTLYNKQDKCEDKFIDHNKPIEYLDENSSKPSIPQDHNILHLAAHMNAGHDVISKICHNVHDQESFNTFYIDSSGRTALCNAAAANSLESINSLYHLEKEVLASKKLVKCLKSNQNSALKSSCRSRKRCQPYESGQCTPIIAAIQAGNDEVVRLLLDEGCSYNTTDQYGRNAVHWAAVTNSITALSRLAQCKGFARLMNMKDDWDRTPIMLAIREGCEEAVEFLLEKQAKIEVVDCMENDCLSLCIEKGYGKIHELLLNYIRSRGLDSKLAIDDNNIRLTDGNPVIRKKERTLMSALESEHTRVPMTTEMNNPSTGLAQCGLGQITGLDWVSLSDNTDSEEMSDCDRSTGDVDEEDDEITPKVANTDTHSSSPSGYL